MKEENSSIIEAYKNVISLNEEKLQDLLIKYLQDIDDNYGWEKHKYVELSDIARQPEFRRFHFKQIQAAATALAAKHKIDFDGVSVINGLMKESINEAEIDSHLRTSLAKILNPIKIQKTVEKVKIEIFLSQFLDNEDMNNFKKIDAIEEVFKHIYGEDIIVKFNGRKITVEEL